MLELTPLTQKFYHSTVVLHGSNGVHIASYTLSNAMCQVFSTKASADLQWLLVFQTVLLLHRKS